MSAVSTALFCCLQAKAYDTSSTVAPHPCVHPLYGNMRTLPDDDYSFLTCLVRAVMHPECSQRGTAAEALMALRCS